MSAPTLCLRDPDVDIWNGDALDVLRTLPDQSVHMVATSPPFYGLRDYGVDGQIGIEDTPDEWRSRLVGVFRECRRVLRDDGTLWVEIGDSYAGKASGGFGDARSTLRSGRLYDADRRRQQMRVNGSRDTPLTEDLKAKDLIGQPWLLAFALRADGWYLRSEIIWHRPNPMPESVTDRPTKSHSTVFLLSKCPRYYYDADAIREPYKYDGRRKTLRDYDAGASHSHPNHHGMLRRERWPGLGKGHARARRDALAGTGHETGHDESLPMDVTHAGANARSVWTIPPDAAPVAHFATWPRELARRLILAGSPEGGTVLDPFGGSGTTALVARSQNRRAILVELNPEYCEMAADRLPQQSLFADREGAA